MNAAVWAAGARVRPLVRASAAFCVGIAAGLALTPYARAATPLFLLLGVGVVSSAALAARSGAGGAGCGRRVLAAFLVAGALHGLAAGRAAAEHPLALLPDGAALLVAGTLEALPARDGSAWLVADSARAERAGAWRPLRARLRLRLSPGARLTAALIATGEWRSTRVPTRLPRRPARAGWLQVRAARALDGGGSIAPRLRAGAQRRLRAWLGDRSGAAEAMLLARREALERSTRRLFAAAGLSHLLAISGLHVGVVAGALLTLVGALRVRRRVGVVIAVAGVAAYVALLGFPHAATRAATQIALLLGARAFQRPADPYALLASAAFAILAFDPLALTEPGFQMSFAGVAGLMAWGRPLQRRLAFLRWRPARTAVAASVAATAATAPVAAWTFSQAAPIGLAANLVAIPVASLAVPTLAAALGVGWLWPDAGAFLAGAGGSLLALLEAFARCAASVPGGHVPVARPGWIALAAAAAGAVATRRLLARRAGRVRRRARAAAAAGVALAAALAVPPAARLLAPPSIELHLIDVGQGDAIAIRTPAGRWVLVDAGPRSDSFDAGRALVAPYLLRHGARDIEALILTHPDADHVGGAGAVVRMLDPGLVLEPAMATGKEPYLDAIRAAQASGSRWARAARGAELRVDGVDLLVLAPDSSALAAASGANDISAVVLVRYGRFRALLMGDAPAEVELRLIARDPDVLRAGVLKVGHHGSHTSTTAELLEVVRPRIALVPVGRRNRYGHPHPVVMERLRVAGATVARTDRHGSVVVRARPDGGARIVQPPLR